MAINLKSLSVDKVTQNSIKNNYLYKDIALDLSPAQSFNAQLNRSQEIKDLNALYDLEAVKNSIRNCFLTTPGQKLLNPTFGVSMTSY